MISDPFALRIHFARRTSPDFASASSATSGRSAHNFIPSCDSTIETSVDRGTRPWSIRWIESCQFGQSFHSQSRQRCSVRSLLFLESAQFVLTVTHARDRVANSGICLGITVLAFCLALVSYHRFDNPLRPTSILLYLAFFLTLASIYKLVIYVIPPLDPFRQSPKTLFYIFNSLPEFICTAIYVGVNLNEEFGILGVEKRDQIKEGV